MLTSLPTPPSPLKRIARELSTARSILCGRGDDAFLAFVSSMQLPEGVSASTTAPVLEAVDLSALRYAISVYCVWLPRPPESDRVDPYPAAIS